MKRALWICATVVLAAATLAVGADAQCRWRHRQAWRGAGGEWGPGFGLGPRAGAAWGRGFRQGFRAGAAVRLYNPATVTTLKGTITAVTVKPARRGRAGGMHVTVNAGQKETEVHLGPAWFAQAEGLALTKGEALEVTGSLVTRGEKTFLIARDVKKTDKIFKLREDDGRPMWAGKRRQP